MTGLALENVTLALGKRVVIDPLTLFIAPGSVVSVMGPSGCGKSSLLNYVCGTLDPAFQASGQVLLRGRDLKDLPVEARRVGILFQDDLLFPHLSVGDNMAFGLAERVQGRAARREAVDEALGEADLRGFYDRDPATLSGGQRARVALMRVLLAAPDALLLDEPFSRLDTALKAQIRAFVFGHAKRRGLPVLLVTHDPEDVAAAGGAIVQLRA